MIQEIEGRIFRFFISFKTYQSVLKLKEMFWNSCLWEGVLVVSTVKAMDYGIVESEFEIQSCYYVHFRTNTHGKFKNPIILPVMG